MYLMKIKLTVVFERKASIKLRQKWYK